MPRLATPELDTAGWKAVLDRCAAEDERNILFSAGEVLLKKDLFVLLDYVRRKLPKAKLAVFTNSSRLTESHIRWFKRRGIRLSASLQGLATYGAMTGTRRKFNRLLTVLARAAELKWPLSVSITITKANLTEATDIFAAAALSDAEAIQVGAMMAEGRGRNHLDLMLTRREWEGVKDAIRALPDLHVPYSFCDEFLCVCREQPKDYLRRWTDSNHAPCSVGRSLGVVGPNGSFRACLHTLSVEPLAL